MDFLLTLLLIPFAAPLVLGFVNMCCCGGSECRTSPFVNGACTPGTGPTGNVTIVIGGTIADLDLGDMCNCNDWLGTFVGTPTSFFANGCSWTTGTIVNNCNSGGYSIGLQQVGGVTVWRVLNNHVEFRTTAGSPSPIDCSAISYPFSLAVISNPLLQCDFALVTCTVSV